MSPEDSLSMYRREQDLVVFNQVERMERIQRRLAAERERHAMIQEIKTRQEKLNALKPQLWELGRLSGMSFMERIAWAEAIVKAGHKEISSRLAVSISEIS